MKLKALIAVFFLTNSFVLVQGQVSELKLSYNFPATVWESEALPIGNGHLGAMVFGDVPVDIIQVNEHSLWSGGPGKNPKYNGGHLRTAAETHQSLQNARRTLQEKVITFRANNTIKIGADGITSGDYPPENEQLRSYIEGLMGDRTDFGSYQSLSNIHIADTQSSAYTNYSRELNIDNATQKITYLQDGVNYVREYFVSYPDNVIVIRLSADKPGKISRSFYLTSSQTNISVRVDNDVITMEGSPADHVAPKRLKFAQQLKVIPTGGILTADENKITVENADEILILSSAATNYIQSMDARFNFFSKKNPLVTVKNTLDRATQKTYTELLNTHIQDYKSLYDRMSV